MSRVTSWSTRAVAAIAVVLVSISGFNAPVMAAAAEGDPKVWVWGDNGFGQLGDGTTVAHKLPVANPDVPEAVDLAGGDSHSLAVRLNGDVLAWGANSAGQLGDGTTTTRKTPTTVAGLSGASAVAAGAAFSLALRDGSVWGWGANGSGQLGDGSGTNRAVAAPIGGLSNVTAIAAGDSHALAVESDGSVWAWGANGSGQLGDGTITNRPTPVQVTGLSDVYAVAAGSTHSLALRRDGTVWSWGANTSGQLGDNTTTQHKTPIQVINLTGVVSIASGRLHNLALLNDGTVRAWGQNSFGQLGLGNTTVTRSPAVVVGLSGITTISTGNYFSLAVNTDGQPFAWGNNAGGQLGDGTVTVRKTAAPVAGVTGIGAISGGGSHTLVAAAIPQPPKPAGWWRADANARDAVADNNATLTGVKYSVGKLRCAWSFKTDTASAALPDTAVFEPGGSFTFSTWISPTDLAGTRTVASKTDGGVGAWSLQVVDGKLRFTASRDGVSQGDVVTTAPVLTTNRWQSVHVVYDGSLTAADRLHMYVDAIAVPVTVTKSPPGTIIDSTAPTRFGAAPGATALRGGLDEMRFFDAPLTALQVSDEVTRDEANVGEDCDTVAPTTTAVVSPAANTAGWNTGTVDVTVTAADDQGGVGIDTLTYSATGATTIPPTTVEAATVTVPVSIEGETTFTVTAADQVGNTSLPATYKARVDRTDPVITAVANPAPNAAGWNNKNLTVGFVCSDAVSGIQDCPAPKYIVSEGTNLTATGTATDNAGHSATTTLTGLKVDQTRPTLTGVPQGHPNAAGWYRGDVTVKWTATDALSGIDESTRPADTVVTGDGSALAARTSVSDVAGNLTSSWSAPFNVDSRAPTTRVATAPRYTADTATITLDPKDNLSGVVASYYTVDGGAPKAGTEFTISADGDHTLSFWSVDAADNVELPVTINVMVDRTAPTITHQLSPAANGRGWNNTDVAVHFVCADGQSGVQECSGDSTVTAEGPGHTVNGKAVDLAGNAATDTATVNIDRVVPTITGLLDRLPDVAGWYNAPVFVRYDCADALSGLSFCNAPDSMPEGKASTLTGKARDAAGNTASATVGPVQVDLTAPTLEGAAAGKAKSGWFNDDVTVNWTCSDGLSGLAGECPAASVVTGEGSGLTAAATASDVAGNTAQDSRVVRIDRTAPVTTATVPAAGTDGVWDHVDVTVSSTDALSGVATTFYAVDGGDVQEATGIIPVTGAGSHSVHYWSVDVAGNVEQENLLAVTLDGLPPTIVGTLTPAANVFGWNNTAVDVRWTCTDGESGVASCGPDATVTDEGAGQKFTGTATDAAGNTATAEVEANVDRTKPTVSAVVSATPNAAGWFNKPVSVRFTCADALSGVISCPATVQLDKDGKNLGTAGEVSDKAGNSASASVNGINLDTVAPVTTATLPEAVKDNWYAGSVDVTLAATDELSGVARTYASVDGAAATAVTGPVTVTGGGAHTVEYWSVDVAGNVESPGTATVSIDEGKPTITGTSFPAPNAAGWNTTPVDVSFTCTDADSGIVSCGPDTTVTTDGKGQVVDGAALDGVGNTASTSVKVNLDTTAPVTSATMPPALAEGWYADNATVTLAATDAVSGVATTYAAVDGATEAPVTGPIVLTGTGGHTVRYWSVDNAGNVELAATVNLSIDAAAPTIAGTGFPEPNAAGWNTTPVDVKFTCTDADSGIASCGPDATVTQDGVGQVVPGTAVDGVGLTASTSVKVNVDSVAPVTKAVLPAATASGWFAGKATVALAATDAVSGVATTYASIDEAAAAAVTAPITVTFAGIHTIRFWSVDNAGNVEVATTVTVNVDGDAPTITGKSFPVANAAGWNTTPVDVKFTCTDAASGIASCGPDALGLKDGKGQAVQGVAVDNAGNTASASVTVNVDTTAPVTTATVPTASASGWYAGKATVALAATDAVSGVATTYAAVDGAAATAVTAPITVTAAGAHTVRYWSVDNAGNVETSKTVNVNIDNGAPTITGKAFPTANAAGWNTTPVDVKFTCTDAQSGIVSCGPDALGLKDGKGQVVNGTAVDGVGSTAKTSVTVNVDTTAPVTTATMPPASAGGWYSSKVTVTLGATDAVSGVAKTYAAIDAAAATAVTAPITVTAAGAHTIRYWSVDNAGNVETAATVNVNIDASGPAITGKSYPAANSLGWNNTPTDVKFTCTDATSGIATCGPDATVTKDGLGQVVPGTAVDRAGNTASTSVKVNVDLTAPVVKGTASSVPNSNGWFNKAVGFTFTCTDALSGVATCPAAMTLSKEGAAQAVNGQGTDNAGNIGTGTVGGVNIDLTAPTLVIQGITSGATYVEDSVPDATCVASDALSGLAAPCSMQETENHCSASTTLTAAVTDKAGNTTTATVTYKVVPKPVVTPTPTPTQTSGSNTRWNGFLGSLKTDDDDDIQVQNAGSTIPMQFEVLDAKGNAVTVAGNSQVIDPVSASKTYGPWTATKVSTSATFSGSNKKYQYNWSTSKSMAGKYWRIGVRMPDGSEHTQVIYLK